MPELPSPAEITGAVGALFGARAAGRGLARLLGPATDEVAEALRRWTAYAVGNVERVVDNASAKVEEPDRPGQVPPRVAMRIFEEGSYSDDAIVIDYLGGVLASSKTPNGRDDRGNTFAALVSRMSTYELRTHYVCYTIMRQLLIGRDINLLDADTVAQHQVFIPYRVYDAAMDFGPDEDGDEIFSHALHWLNRDELMSFIVAGNVPHIRRQVPHAEEAGMIVKLTVPGIALYMWAHGQGRHPIHRFLDPEQSWEFQTAISISAGSHIVAEMTPPSVPDSPPIDAT